MDFDCKQILYIADTDKSEGDMLSSQSWQVVSRATARRGLTVSKLL